jgi:hypothetical protein
MQVYRLFGPEGEVSATGAFPAAGNKKTRMD